MKKVLFTVLALAAVLLVSCDGKKSTENNPFMSEYANEYGIPPFDKITYADYAPAVDAGIEQQNAEIDSIIKNTAEPNFENTILALDNSGEILSKVSGVMYALSESDNTPEMQTKAFEALGISDEDIQERFGHLVNAFKYGAPPHGGLAYGLDRLVMLMTGASSIRDVIAFPKVQNASDLMMHCPDVVDDKQLDELSIAVTRMEEEAEEEE